MRGSAFARWVAAAVLLATTTSFSAAVSASTVMTPRQHAQLGVDLMQQQRLDEAVEQLRLAIEGDSSLHQAHQLLARAELARGQTVAALEALRRAASMAPLDRDLATRLVSAELASGREAAARAQLESLVDRFQSTQAALLLARGDLRARRYVEAGRWLDLALGWAPNSEEVLYEHARLSLASKQPLAAIQVLEPLVRMHQAVGEYVYLLGVARLQLGDLGGAIDTLREALPLQVDRALTLFALGLALNKKKRYDEAKDVLVECLALAPSQGDAIAALAESEAGLGNLESASDLARRALEVVGDHATAHLVLGLIDMREQRYEQAIESLLRSATADPEAPRPHYQLSLAYARLGQTDASRRHRELYAKAQQAIENELLELDREVGLGVRGHQP